MRQMSDVHLRALLNAVCKDQDDSWTLLSFLGVRIVIEAPDNEEPVVLRSSQVPWTMSFKFLD